MPACHIQPENLKKFISAVGEELVRRHGKRKFYTPHDVRHAALRCGISPHLHIWAFCFFCTAVDFHALHGATGESPDYTARRAEILDEIATEIAFQSIDVSLSWLEWPDIDLSSVFDWFDLF